MNKRTPAYAKEAFQRLAGVLAGNIKRGAAYDLVIGLDWTGPAVDWRYTGRVALFRDTEPDGVDWSVCKARACLLWPSDRTTAQRILDTAKAVIDYSPQMLHLKLSTTIRPLNAPVYPQEA